MEMHGTRLLRRAKRLLGAATLLVLAIIAASVILRAHNDRVAIIRADEYDLVETERSVIIKVDEDCFRIKAEDSHSEKTSDLDGEESVQGRLKGAVDLEYSNVRTGDATRTVDDDLKLTEVRDQKKTGDRNTVNYEKANKNLENNNRKNSKITDGHLAAESRRAARFHFVATNRSNVVQRTEPCVVEDAKRHELDGRWFNFSTSSFRFYAYSAIFDDRKSLLTEPVIRIMAVSDDADALLRIGIRLPLCCVVHYVNGSTARIPIDPYPLRIGHGLLLNGKRAFEYIYTCSVGKLSPVLVSVVDSTRDTEPSACMPVERPRRPKSSRMNDFIVCVPVVYGSLDPFRLIEWLELQRILGVALVGMTVLEVDEASEKVLRHYSEVDGLLELRRTHPIHPGEKDHRRLHSTPVINDCLLRHMHEFRRMMVLDVDELIVPRRHDNLRDLVAFLDRGGETRGEGRRGIGRDRGGLGGKREGTSGAGGRDGRDGSEEQAGRKDGEDQKKKGEASGGREETEEMTMMEGDERTIERREGEERGGNEGNRGMRKREEGRQAEEGGGGGNEEREDGDILLHPDESSASSPVNYAFRNNYFFLDLPSDDQIPGYLTVLRYRKKCQVSPVGYSIKSIINPQACSRMHNHFCWGLTAAFSHRPNSLSVDPSLALNQHYKRCHFDRKTCDSMTSNVTQDDVLLRYKILLTERVREKVEIIMGLGT